MGTNNNLFFDDPFRVVSVDGQPLLNKTYSIKGTDSLVVKMSLEQGGLLINKTTTFYGEGYEIHHKFDVVGGGDFRLGKVPSDAPFYISWLGGLRHAEKDRFFELSQYTQSYIAQEKNIEDFSFNAESQEAERVFYNGKTDWSAIRNKYFVNAFIAPSSGSVASGGFLGGNSFQTASQHSVPEYSMGLRFNSSSSLFFQSISFFSKSTLKSFL